MVMIAWTKLILYGMIIGIANIIPGVSGGTMAVILNVYTQLIRSISSITSHFRRSIRFLVPLLAGAGAGIFLFSALIEASLSRFPMATNFFFLGLILGSLPMLYRKTAANRIKFSSVLCFIIGVALMLSTVWWLPVDESAAIMTELTMPVFIRLLLVSTIASTAMIIPGISGSFVMLLFGCYTTVLAAISNLRIEILLPIAIGCIIGILAGAKLIDVLFRRFPSQTYAGVGGLVLASTAAIYPGFMWTIEGIAALCLLAGGAALTMWFSSDKRQRISVHKKRNR